MQSAIWNSIFTDLSSALTTVMTQLNTQPTFANILYPNGSFNIWQRGAGASSSFAVSASSTQYTADRWYITTGANQAFTVAATTALDVSAAAAHACKVTRNSGQTGVGAITFGYPLTADELASINGQKVSFNGAVKAGANWSPTNGTLAINLYVGTGAAAKRGGGFASETNPLSISVNVAAGATNLAVSGTSTGVVAATSTQGELQVTWTPVGTAGADDSVTFDDFCLVPGAIVIAYESVPFDHCLRECKKFYRKSFPYSVAPVQNGGLPGALAVVAQAASNFSIFIPFEPVEMYATASFTAYNPSGASANWNNNSSAGVSVTNTIDTNMPSAKGVLFIAGATVSAAALYSIHYSADAGL